ncbi:MAG: DUF4411 family protein [Lachnospiraceae bacterium]|nr:DUF4411 family protein [Lachnospiraceae bacterium]
MVEKEKFLIDTNSFVAPYRLYYAFDLVPTYWKELSKKADTGRLILLDMVKDEIDKGQDALSDWLAQQTGFIVCSHVSEKIINQYQEVLRYVQTCGLYREQALAAWAPANIADPWLIAVAKVNDYTIITGEVSSGGLSPKTPNKNAKIPDVANAFGVKTADLYYMMRQLAIKI